MTLAVSSDCQSQIALYSRLRRSAGGPG
jgi:hypothetical protein